MKEGCGKQCQVDGYIYIMCGSFFDDNPKKGYFLCHECNGVSQLPSEKKK